MNLAARRPLLRDRALFLFSTGEARVYYDSIEISQDSQVRISYEGQRQVRKNDSLLANPINNIHVFHRPRYRESFVYLGKAESAEIVRERTEETPICVRYCIHQKIQKCDPNNPFASLVGKFIAPKFDKPQIRKRFFDYRYRNGVFDAFHARPIFDGRQGIQLVTLFY